MKTAFRLLPLFGLLLLLANACKKKDETQSVQQHFSGPWCTLQSVVESSGGCKDSTWIGYDGSQITSAVRVNNCPGGMAGTPLTSHKWFVYEAGKVFILDTSFMADKDTLIVDAALHVLEQHRASAITGNTGLLGRYTYSPQGLLQSSVIYFTQSGTDSVRYTFSNGDLVEAAGKTNILHYQYYDKAVPANGYVTQNGLNFGSAFLYKNAHLLKAITDGSGNVSFSYAYDFDAYGNVVRKIRTAPVNGRSDTTMYQYLCAVE